LRKKYPHQKEKQKLPKFYYFLYFRILNKSLFHINYLLFSPYTQKTLLESFNYSYYLLKNYPILKPVAHLLLSTNLFLLNLNPLELFIFIKMIFKLFNKYFFFFFINNFFFLFKKKKKKKNYLFPDKPRIKQIF
jgi:hypothetical protein